MNGPFGLELPTPVNFVIAFVVVLALIGAATWAVRRFGATRLEAGARNRQPRLAVIDSSAVDGRRKLVIIRRDNVEHLLMIGGPTDVVVETNIVRAPGAASREAPATRANGGDTLPRAMPLPDASHWPLQPEPAVPATAARPVRVDENAQWPEPAPAAPAAAPPLRVQRNTEALADLAQPAAVAAPAPAPVRAAPAAPAVRAVAAAKPAAPAIQALPVHADPQAAAAHDQNLASMAHQLEEALRRPQAEAARPVEQKRIEPKLAVPPRPAAAPKPAPAVAVAAPAAAPAVAAQPKPINSLEQEMASLLGRPGKT